MVADRVWLFGSLIDVRKTQGLVETLLGFGRSKTQLFYLPHAKRTSSGPLAQKKIFLQG